MMNRIFAGMFVIVIATFTSAVAVALHHRKKKEEI
jgi:hypothetical protein